LGDNQTVGRQANDRVVDDSTIEPRKASGRAGSSEDCKFSFKRPEKKSLKPIERE
jgi:hypothetical protein